MATPRAAVVYNPIKVDIEKVKSAVAAAESEAGWAETLWFETTEEDAGQGVTASAIRRGASVVIAAGGDGTVRAVAEALRDSGVSLALLPSGTGNLLARNLELPLTNLEQAVEIAFTGDDRQIDLGMVEIVRADGDSEEHAFLVMAGLGLDAKMIKNTNSTLKKAVGWLAYVEDLALSWTSGEAEGERPGRDELVDHCEAALDALLAVNRTTPLPWGENPTA